MIVADTSPLSAFLRIQRPDLLSSLFGSISIPGAVAMELDHGAALVGPWRSAMPFVIEHPVEPSPLLHLLQGELDPGEAEAIALASAGAAQLLVIDEAKGRAAARRLGLKVVGAAGICVLAKERGLVPAAGPLLEDLRRRGGLWLGDTLIREVLTRIGE